MPSHTDRVVVLVDMDCFYCQVEERLDPSLVGKPIAVVQYNAWKGGGIIAVNYPARDRGVTRHMRGNEAKDKCPEIVLVRVPNVRGKADLTKYREAGKRVAEVLQTFTSLLQRASVDEAYLDITEEVNRRISSGNKITIEQIKNTHVVGAETKDFLYNVYNNELGGESNIKLLVGGAIVEEIRGAVYEKTGYRCSAGIAHNKILAKLACGIHKPNKQTILPQDGVEGLYENLPLKKIKSLGGKFGISLSEKLKITNMGELAKISEQDLLKIYDEKNALWLYNIARGIDTEPVTVRLVSKSIGCCKKFPGKNALKTIEDVNHWLSELAEEIAERLEQDFEENNRKAKNIIINYAQQVGRKDVHSSRTQALNSYEAKKIAADAFELLKKYTQKTDGSFHLKFLGISAGKFEDCKKVNNITTFFKQAPKNDNKFSNSPKSTTKRNSNLSNFLNKNKVNDTQENDVLYKVSDGTDEINSDSLNLTKLNTNLKQNSDRESLHLSDIERDAEESLNINLNEPLKSLKIFIDGSDDDYSNSTVEFDFSDQLKNKQEFPNFHEPTNNNLIPDSFDNNSCDSFSSRKSSPVLGKPHFGDTSNSFFIKYVQNKKSPVMSTSNQIDQEAGCSYQQNKSPVTSYNPSTSNQVEVYQEDSCSQQQNKKNNRRSISPEMFDSDCSTDANICEKDNISTDLNDDRHLDFELDEIHQVCPECSEQIPEVEFVSHMDHHMALKLMAEEKKMFQEELKIHKEKTIIKTPLKSPKASNKKSTRSAKSPKIKAVKRKATEADKNVTIATFFSKTTNKENTLMESCDECGKLIAIDDFACHLDFHAAKKLHLELNPVIKVTSKSENKIAPKKNNSKNAKNLNTSVNSLSNFFKPVQN